MNSSDMRSMTSCPFCGDAGPELTQNPTSGLYYVACTRGSDCEARGPSRMDERDAIDAWNSLVPRGGPLPLTHWTCGTAHIRAERTLQIISHVRASEIDAMEMIAGLVDEAGHDNAVRWIDDSDVPF